MLEPSVAQSLYLKAVGNKMCVPKDSPQTPFLLVASLIYECLRPCKSAILNGSKRGGKELPIIEL